MTELQPPDAQINGGSGGTLIVAPPIDNVGTKRQRRPSVRLGDIGGDQTLDSHLNPRRSNKHLWKNHQTPFTNKSNSSSKTRTLMNLSGSEFHETLDADDKEGNLDSVAIGSWKVRDSKSKRRSIGSTKRIRSNWVSKNDGGGRGDDDEDDDVDKYSGGDGDGFREFGDSDSPIKDNSPVNSMDNLGVEREEGHYRRGSSRARGVMEGGIELDGPSDTNGGRNWNNCNGERNSVREWLNEMGLGRYAPVFEIHEVDDEVLPLLTLEDLKDMGINAVGSRRKMYSSIQKLSKSFSSLVSSDGR